MSETFYQVCYTRLGLHEGWQSINVSKNTPYSLVSFFERNAVNNEVKREVPFDKNGKPLWMYEIMAKNNIVGVSRTQYGLSDAFGRSSYFSHGFLFENGYHILKDPNYLLTISNINFKNNEVDSKSIPNRLQREKKFSCDEILVQLGLNKEKYAILVKCVYYSLSTETKNVIYVHYNGDDEMCKKLLYLIYIAIPYSLRIKLSACTCIDIENIDKTIVFYCEDLPKNVFFVNPQTGENNILTNVLNKRWSRYPFIEWFVKNYDNPSSYYKMLANMEYWLNELGSNLYNNMDILRLAFDMSMYNIADMSDDDLHGVLYDWLTLPKVGTASIENNISKILCEITNRRMTIPNEIENIIQGKYDTFNEKEIKIQYSKYYEGLILHINVDKACVKLKELEINNSKLFEDLKNRMISSNEGKFILAYYYKTELDKLLNNQSCTADYIISFYSKCENISEFLKRAIPKLHEKNVEISINMIKTSKPYNEVIEQYKKVEEEINSFKKVPSLINKCYDEHIMENFNINNLADYEDFYLNVFNNKEMTEFLNTLKDVENKKYELIEQYIYIYNKFLSKNKRLTKVLFNYMIECDAIKDCYSIYIWKKLAEIENKSLSDVLIGYRAGILCNSYILKRSLNYNKNYWNKYEYLKAYLAIVQKAIKELTQYKSELKKVSDIIKVSMKKIRNEEKTSNEKKSILACIKKMCKNDDDQTNYLNNHIKVFTNLPVEKKKGRKSLKK